jgi:ubiquinol-cytochrome c reductase iron-sulfur subunit
MDSSKRTWLIASGCAGAVGTAALATPFVTSFAPSERAKAAGAAVEVDIAGVKPGEKLTVEWRGKPVWIMRRTPEQMATLKKTRRPSWPIRTPSAPPSPRPNTPATKPARARSTPKCWWWSASARTWAARRSTSSRPAPSPRCPTTGKGGFFCPCHGSTFDLAGRVFKNKPAPDNLEVPPYMYPGRRQAADRRRQEGINRGGHG